MYIYIKICKHTYIFRYINMYAYMMIISIIIVVISLHIPMIICICDGSILNQL